MENADAVIEIGGPLNAAQQKALLMAAVTDRASTDWNTPVRESVLAEAIQALKPLRLVRAEAPWGRLEALETFCCQHGLTFKRVSDPVEGCGYLVAYWSPEMAVPIERPSDEKGDPVVSLTDLKTHLMSGFSLAQVIALWDVPPVPPLTLSADPATRNPAPMPDTPRSLRER